MRVVGNAEMSVSDQVARTAAQFGPDFDPTVLTLAMTLYRSMAVFDRAHAAELAPHGLNLVQFNVISVLHRATAPMTMGDLAQAVSVRPANLTSLVDGLVKRGLVARELNPDDRRSFLVRVSPEGQDFLASFLPGHWRYLDALTGGLSARQRTQLTKLLERLAQSVQDAEVRLAGSASLDDAPLVGVGADRRDDSS
ncbi:MarR family winged helix-turn-helix transcriptional regulator [Pseudonocardia sp. H11422]|uniref:MarR family winged helix-turn-helix transcriptional regulator n=1 Tax=Pseudonocardia sp. H11422 TaxID=2835866 RepID=UPI001BDD9E52|nr:MarR family transcriptional regulator [Pseudonocardia sp. H11422]